MIVKSIEEMTEEECIELQMAMLYPWEIESYNNYALNISDKDLRYHLMDALDQRIVDIEVEESEKADSGNFMGLIKEIPMV